MVGSVNTWNCRFPTLLLPVGVKYLIMYSQLSYVGHVGHVSLMLITVRGLRIVINHTMTLVSISYLAFLFKFSREYLEQLRAGIASLV